MQKAINPRSSEIYLNLFSLKYILFEERCSFISIEYILFLVICLQYSLLAYLINMWFGSVPYSANFS